MSDVRPGAELQATNTNALDEFERLRRFIHYMQDYGVQAQWLVVFAKDLYGGRYAGDGQDETPLGIFQQLYGDAIEGLDIGTIFSKVFGGSQGPAEIDLEKVAGGGASLELLVRYAKQVPRSVLPEDCLPSDETVARVLGVFHQMTRQRLNEEAAKVAGADVESASEDPYRHFE